MGELHCTGAKFSSTDRAFGLSLIRVWLRLNIIYFLITSFLSLFLVTFYVLRFLQIHYVI